MTGLLPIALLLGIAQAAPNLIVVSLDTTRADALSCYGRPPDLSDKYGPTTPHIDAIAAEGLRLEHFWANAPTTLSSHTTMLSGTDPHTHTVVRNGFAVPPEVQTLPQRLSAEGYDTVAVLGSTALERAMGLDRGFRVYDDTAPDLLGMMYQDRAAGVVDRTLAHLDARPSDGPLFLFTHFYDAHTPYRAPEPWTDKFTDPAYTGPWRDETHPVKELIRDMEAGTASSADLAFIAGRYAGEIAYMDAELGRLLDGLQARGLLANALVVITADHGENLSDFPFFAYSHGSDVGLGVMRIPLVMRGYGVPLAQHAVITRHASLSGLAPTLERALGLEPRLAADGHPFWELIRPGPVWDADGWPERATRPAPMEATRPRSLEPEEGWNNLVFFRGLWAGGWGMFGAPVYDLDYAFYGELGRPAAEDVLPILVEELAEWDATAPAHRDAEMAPATQRALKSLGYLED